MSSSLSNPKSARSSPLLKALVASTSAVALVFVVMDLLKAWKVRHPPGRRVRKGMGEGVNSLTPEYDVVIVGGGTAGCVLAARLSEDPRCRVLLLEAGVSGASLLQTRVPAIYNELFLTKHDYNLYTTPQAHAGGGRKYWPRAKMLGGCSSINAMMFHAGAPEDYDEWSRALSGQEGAEQWTYKEFQRYLLKFEKFTPHSKHNLVDAQLRGSSGPVEVGYNGNYSEVCEAFVQACDNLGIRSVPDVNTAAGSLGATRVMTYIDRQGRRVTTETAYLTKDVLERPNLTVVTNAHVTRIITDQVGRNSRRAIGVEYASGQERLRFRVRVKYELILSAGAVHTPQILMLSGVGPADHLRSKGIPVVIDLPGVGKNLQDHLVVHTRYSVPPEKSLNTAIGKTAWLRVKSVKCLIQWLLTGQGPMRTNGFESAAFMRSHDPKLFPKTEFREMTKDLSSGPTAPDLEIFSSPIGFKDNGHSPIPQGSYMTLSVVLLRPQSRGTITLSSKVPFDAPVIDPNYLAERNDVATIVRGIKLLAKLARTEPLRSIINNTDNENKFLDHNLLELSPEQLEAEIRDRAETLYHPACSTRMARREDGGVVDAGLRVYGLQNVSIADAGVFPTIVAGHTAAPTIAIAEKVADFIKQRLANVL